MNTVRCPLQSGDEGAALLSYLDRRLDSASTEALDRHVAVCPDCARVVAAQRSVWNALDQWEPVAARADFDERVMARIAADERPWWRRLWSAPSQVAAWWKPAMPVAALCCAALLTVMVWRGPANGGWDGKAPGLDSAEVQQVEEALSDLEMLRQLGLTEVPQGAGPAAVQSL